MNKPIHPVFAPDGGSPSYDEDAYAWAIAQAEFLRSGQIDRIDWINVAEEIEDVARSERRAAESALRIMMMHILKWRMQPERRGASWAGSIATQRVAYDQVLDENPSLQSHADDMRSKAFRRARIEAAGEMNVPIATIPEEPFSWDLILRQPFEIES